MRLHGVKLNVAAFRFVLAVSESQSCQARSSDIGIQRTIVLAHLDCRLSIILIMTEDEGIRIYNASFRHSKPFQGPMTFE